MQDVRPHRQIVVLILFGFLQYKTFLDLLTIYWIGVHDRDNESFFVNMLNETVLYKKWAADQPNNMHNYKKFYYMDADCVKMTSAGWFDVPCAVSMPAICSKRNIEPLQKTSSTPTASDTSVDITVSHTSKQATTQSTTTALSTVAQATAPTITLSSTKLTTMEQFTVSQTSVQTLTQPTTTDPLSILQTSMQTTSSSVQSTEETTVHVSQKRECLCPCTRMKNLVIIKNEAELLMKIDNIKKELAVNKSLLSSSIRKRTSAVDPRPSASIVGGTISVVIIATVIGLIVLSDLTRLINFCWKTISKRWNRKTRAVQKEKV